MFPELPWEALGANAPFGILIGVLFLAAFLFFCLYRLDRIPNLSIPGVIVILVILKVTDVATFLWSAGGEYAANELNPLYQIAAVFLPHSWAILSTQAGVTALAWVALWLLWVGRVPRWLWLAIIATLSAVSISGTASNVLSYFWLW